MPGAFRRTALCAVRSSAHAVSAANGGVSNPAVWTGLLSRPLPGGLLTPLCLCRNVSRFLAAICAPNAHVLSCANAPQIRLAEPTRDVADRLEIALELRRRAVNTHVHESSLDLWTNAKSA